MLKTKYIIILVVLSVVLCVGLITLIRSLSKSKPTIDTINQTRYFPNKTLFYDQQSFEDDRMVYVVCDKQTPTKCQIIQDKYPFKPNTIHSCNITLDANGTVQHPHILTVTPFGENRAILLWDDIVKKNQSEASIRITVINLNECKQTADFILNGTSDLLHRLRYKHIVTYNDTFDVFFKDPKQCGDDTVCKLNINYEGKATEEPVEFLKINSYYMGDIYPIAAHSPAKGYVYSKRNAKATDAGLFLKQHNGTEKQLTPTDTYFGVSVVNEMIGMCSHLNLYPNFNVTNITCLQYNADGELRFNVSYNPIARPHKNSSYIHSVFESIYTLPDEGFLLQFYEFAKCKNETDCEYLDTRGYYMVKLDKTGKKVCQYYFEEHDYHFGKNEERHFWKNQDKEDYCTMLISDEAFDRFNLTTTCFTDAIFS